MSSWRSICSKEKCPSHPLEHWIRGNIVEHIKTLVVLTFVTFSVEWLESDWKHGGADVLHQRCGANADIEAGEIVLELEPGGGDLKDETAQQPSWT